MTLPNLQSSGCPYRGLQPFLEQDRKYFFGRERDQEIIISNLFAAPLTVFYGASGVGKSSVLMAGVVPELRSTPRLAVIVFREWQDAGFENTLKRKVLEAIALSSGQTSEIDLELDFDEFLIHCLESFRGNLFFILDQFEEYFLYHPVSPGTEKFDAALAKAVNRSEVGANFLLSMRDDGLSKLDRFQKRIPNLLNNMLRLEHLDRSSAADAIRLPLRRFNELHANGVRVDVETELVDVLLNDLATGKVTLDLTGQGKIKTARRDRSTRVETPFLQVVLTSLWETENAAQDHPDPSVRQLRLETYRNLGGATTIVRTHLDRVMDAERLAPYRDAAAALFHHLVTPSGQKIAHTLADLAFYTQRPEADIRTALNQLIHPDVRILRPVAPAPDQRDVVRYEVFHDVLAPAILDWRNRYTQKQAEEKAAYDAQIAAEQAAEEARKGAEVERIKAEQLAAERQREAEQALALAEEQRRRAQAEERLRVESEIAVIRFRRLSTVLAIVCLLMVAIAFLAGYFGISSVRAKNRAEEAERMAKLAEEKAKTAQGDAERAAAVAEGERARAADAEGRAKENLEIAKSEKRRADDRAQEAIDAKKGLETALLVANNARKTDDAYRQAFRLSRQNARKEEAIGPFRNALAVYNRSSEGIDQQAAIDTMLNMGAVYADLDNDTEATNMFEQALARAVDDKQRVRLLTAIGDIYREIKPKTSSYDPLGLTPFSAFAIGTDPRERALSYYQTALEVIERMNELLARRAEQIGEDEPFVRKEIKENVSEGAGILVSLGQVKLEMVASKPPEKRQDAVAAAQRDIETAIGGYRFVQNARGEAYALAALAEAKMPGGFPAQSLAANAEIEQLLRASLAKYPADANPKWKIPLLRKLTRFTTDKTEQVRLLQQVIDINSAAGDRSGQATALIELATLVNLDPDLEYTAKQRRVLALYSEAADLYESSRWLEKAAETLMESQIKYPYDQRFEARPSLERAARLYGQRGRWEFQMRALLALVELFAESDRTLALSYLGQMSDIARSRRDDSQQASALERLAYGYVAVKDVETAGEHLEKALQIYQSERSTSSAWSALLRISEPMLRRGFTDKAIAYLERARTLASKNDEPAMFIALGEAYAKKGDLEKATEFYEAAAKLTTGQNPYVEVRALMELGTLYDRAGDLESSIARLKKAIELGAYFYDEGKLLIQLGSVYEKKPEPALALQLYERALKYYVDRKIPYLQIEALAKIRDFYKKQGDTQKAEEYDRQVKQLSQPSPPPPP